MTAEFVLTSSPCASMMVNSVTGVVTGAHMGNVGFDMLIDIFLTQKVLVDTAYR